MAFERNMAAHGQDAPNQPAVEHYRYQPEKDGGDAALDRGTRQYHPKIAEYQAAGAHMMGVAGKEPYQQSGQQGDVYCGLLRSES